MAWAVAAGTVLLFRLQLLLILPTTPPSCFSTFYPKAVVTFTPEAAVVAFKDVTAARTLLRLCLVMFGVVFLSKDVQLGQS